MDETQKPTSDNKLTGLSRCLVMGGIFSHESAIEHQQKADEATLPLISYLVENKIVDSLTIASAVSREFGIPLFDLNAMDTDVVPINLVSENLIRKHNLLPLYKRGSRLFVAVSDPLNLSALNEIKFHADSHIEAVLVEENKLRLTIQKILDTMDTTMEGLDDDELDELDINNDYENTEEDLNESDINDTPIVRFVNKILIDAIKQNASDLHFEPFEKFYRIRYRIDGVLTTTAEPPVSLTQKIAARIKVMSQLDISERRIPQDGRMRMVLSKHRTIDFRVSTCPTLFGEKIVMRILDPGSAQLGIGALGYDEEQKELYLNALEQPNGMILVTGPTGSGKTVSLYTGLNILNTEERNISTAEDPAEINLPGINQVNVQPKVGLTFSAALKSFLRQDPDVIMVGEIRDLETAEIAIKAAQTGHLVLSTLHTNDAPQTLTRLINMGVAPFNVASSVSLIIAQRLARRLCTNCKQVTDIPVEALLKEGFEESTLENLTIYKAVGCDQCHQGYKGRIGVYQVMPISEAMSRLIMEGGNALQLGELSKKEGVADLRMSGLKKVAQGLTTLDEINRVITS